jgi:hypothetical protein
MFGIKNIDEKSISCSLISKLFLKALDYRMGQKNKKSPAKIAGLFIKKLSLLLIFPC